MFRSFARPADGRVPNVGEVGLCIQIVADYPHSHQWMFITDTVDAVYRPDDWFPEAMMDQLAEIAGSLPVGVRPFICQNTLLPIDFATGSLDTQWDHQPWA